MRINLETASKNPVTDSEVQIPVHPANREHIYQSQLSDSNSLCGSVFSLEINHTPKHRKDDLKRLFGFGSSVQPNRANENSSKVERANSAKESPPAFDLGLLWSLTPENEQEYLDKVRQDLIQKKVDVNQRLAEKSLLSVAVTMGSLKFVELFLEFGADVHAKDESPILPFTPFVHALLMIDIYHKEVYSEIAMRLLEKGANPNTFYRDLPALHIAIRNKEKALFQALLNKKADVSVKDGLESTPLDAVLDEYLISYLEKEKESLLAMAQALIKHGVDINQVSQNPPFLFKVIDRKWYTLANWAIKNCSNLDLNATNAHGKTLLQCLIDRLTREDSKNNPELLELVQLLIEKGADLNQNALIHEMVLFGMKDVLEMMLKSKRVNINQLREGRSPLDRAKLIADKNKKNEVVYRPIQKMLSDAGAQFVSLKS